MNIPARILLADDHEIVRDGLAAHLRMLGDFEIVHAWSLATLMAAAAPPGCDLAVVDVHMPGMEGGQGLAALCAAYPTLPLIIITGAATLPHAGQWQSWPSVRAIVHKSSPVSQLRAAVDLALAHVPSEGVNESGVSERAVKSRPVEAQSAGIAWAMASICNAERVVFGGEGGHEGFVHTFSAPAPPPGPWGDADALGALSPRLAQVAKSVAQGLSNQQIAAALGLSEGTVKQYLKDIFRTLGVTNRTQLALLLHRRS